MTRPTRQELRAFVDRDWERIARLKEESWIEHKRSLTPDEILRLGEALWLQARLVRPEGPSDDERLADLENHARVGELLRSVAHPGATPPRAP